MIELNQQLEHTKKALVEKNNQNDHKETDKELLMTQKKEHELKIDYL